MAAKTQLSLTATPGKRYLFYLFSGRAFVVLELDVGRKIVIAAELRILEVGAEDRVIEVGAVDRIMELVKDKAHGTLS